MTARVQEADANYKKGEEALKTKFLIKRKPDYAAAAPLFDKAATGYRNAKMTDRAVDAYIKSAECFFQCQSAFTAGTKVETAALLTKEGDAKKAAELYSRAADYYVQSGKVDKACSALNKGAKCVEAINPAISYEFYKRSLELHLDAERELFTDETFKNLLNLQVKEMKYFEALETLAQWIQVNEKLDRQPQAFKCYLSVIILRLVVGDHVAAEQALSQYLVAPGFFASEEQRVATGIMDAFEAHDEEALKKIVSKAIVTYLEPQIAKVARDLRIPEDFVAASATRVEHLRMEDLEPVKEEARTESPTPDVIERHSPVDASRLEPQLDALTLEDNIHTTEPSGGAADQEESQQDQEHTTPAGDVSPAADADDTPDFT